METVEEAARPVLAQNQLRGLSECEVEDRRKQFGPNTLPEKKGRTALGIYLSQYKNPLIYIILAAGLISFVLGEYNDVYIIAGVIILDTAIGFYQEYKAEKGLEALKRLLRPRAAVLREGTKMDVDTSELVPDDVVFINDGDKIPADGQLLEAVSLSLNEAILTGESEPVTKRVSDDVYMGTTVFSGRGVIKLTSTGSATQLGKIASSISTMKEESTPLQLRLDDFGKFLTYVVTGICVCVLVIGLLSGTGLLEMIEISIVLAIAAIPEGLPVAVTMILVLGMRSILKRKGLVKKLLAVETLGSVTVICTDKTGTLTEGVMRVVQTDFASKDMAIKAMTLCNNLADSLEASLWNYVKSTGQDPQTIFDTTKRVYEIPFSSEKKYMLTTNIIDDVEVSLVKGAPEVVTEFCKVTPAQKKSIVSRLEDWAKAGLKPLALAYKREDGSHQLQDYTWIGLIGIDDPVRETVKDAIALCRSAGIRVKVISGDYRGTAQKVASAIGLTFRPDQVLEGKELETIPDAEFTAAVNEAVVFCRVVPHQKLRIVEALQSRGEVVAMIGDGVNDAPALKKSNIGVAVGNATDVAQETASLILLDNNFGTLVNAVEEGRIIFENIKKSVAYVLSDSFAEIFLIVGAMLLHWPAPLTVIQILWIHLICDGPADIVLGFERERGVMEKPPKSLKESVLDRRAKYLIPAISLISAALALFLFWFEWRINADIVLGRTIAFTTIAVQDLIYLFSYRSFDHSVFTTKDFFSNKPLIGAVILGFIEQALALYVPALSHALEVTPLRIEHWAMSIGASVLILLVIEAVKHWVSPEGRKPTSHTEPKTNPLIELEPRRQTSN